MTSKIPPANGKIYIAPSILAADLWRLGEEVTRVEKAGADWLHVDIMDGHFVPNLSFGPALVSSLKGKTSLPLDVHLMVAHPQQFIEPFAQAGADLLTVHAEAQDNVKDVLKQIHALGVKAGVSVKPDTDVNTVQPLLDEVDLILVMSVYPGFGGQAFLPGSPAPPAPRLPVHAQWLPRLLPEPAPTPVPAPAMLLMTCPASSTGISTNS